MFSFQGNPRHSNDSGIMVNSPNSNLDAFNKVVQAVERKKGKLQELVLTEESYLDNLEAVERILLEAKKARKDDSMPKQLRYTPLSGSEPSESLFFI